MAQKGQEAVRKAVRARYGEIAEQGIGGEGCSPSGCCVRGQVLDSLTTRLGYAPEQVQDIPEGANMGLGCGNPMAFADLKNGEVVLDLGSGGGFDCFQAARKVGPEGQVIGVDMTPEMVSKAREYAAEGNFANVDFRLGEIEALPVADNSVDIVISNCVINLSPDKERVFRDAHRVLKKGGRISISDIMATAPMPAELRNDMALLTGCVAGAASMEELKDMLRRNGFQDIRITPREQSRDIIPDWLPGRDVEDYVVSATIQATKPKGVLESPRPPV